MQICKRGSVSVKKRKIISVISIVVLLLSLHIHSMQNYYYNPKYSKIDLTDILNKEILNDKDLDALSKQTGIAPKVINELFENGDKDILADMQDMYFESPDVKRSFVFFPVTAEERNKTQITNMPSIKKGDILVTFNTSTLGWRHGHSALVVDEVSGKIIEHLSVGNTSTISYIESFMTYPAFVVLRYPDEEVANKAADYAVESLVDVDYNIFTGILKKDKSDMEKPDSSHCSHIVWQAYKYAGVDIDENKGSIVLPKDISLSSELQVVQIYGINPQKYKQRMVK